MSSIMEKNKIRLESRSKMFLRSNSFQKLCSLAPSMGLKGFKSNKEALKSVFESLIVTTRGVIQSVTYRILCFLFLAPFDRLVGRPLSILSGEDGKFSTIKLILKLTLSTIVSSDKTTGGECDKDAVLVVAAAAAAAATKPNLPRTVDSAIQTEDATPAESDATEEQFFDCKEDRPRALRPSTAELREQLLRNSRPSDPAATSRSVPLGLLVYGCVLGCFAQLSALAYLLNVSVRTPPGLIFLVASLAYIGYVMMRIFLDEQPSSTFGTNTTKPPPTRTTSCMALIPVTSSEPPKPKGIHPILAIVGKYLATMLQRDGKLVPISGGSSSRMSRRSTPSRSRMLLCTHDKTISKMKIL
ncbi:uncharacterized protein LOC128734977 [Sabethes cyaneus]|uniref:uncharacterized protein LOC128734977 n=1 Tax=Sabethes cyaneus TaxID=53552 RepID=UPI00237D6B6B|nr:uncharacterized protein LOC128734977 [Sabethes cyaneus]